MAEKKYSSGNLQPFLLVLTQTVSAGKAIELMLILSLITDVYLIFGTVVYCSLSRGSSVCPVKLFNVLDDTYRNLERFMPTTEIFCLISIFEIQSLQGKFSVDWGANDMLLITRTKRLKIVQLVGEWV